MGKAVGMFTLGELDRAEAIVRRHVPPTAQYAWPLLATEVGTETWVKHENHTRAGAFKVRGGLVYVARLVERGEAGAGLITATRGNHGQSIAYAGRAAGVPVTIVVPHGNSAEKNAAMLGFGGELIEHGHDFQAAREYAAKLAADQGLTMVPSFDRDLVLGVATYARELLTAAELDAVYVPIGLGSGICGVITVRDLLGLRTEVVGVVAERAAATQLSVAAGRVVSTDTADTFIDGVACRVPDEQAIAVIAAGASRIIAISEDECAEAMRVMLRTTHNMPEPAGAAALAGLLQERELQRGRRVAVVLTGGNLDAPLLAQVLAGQTPTP
jgi:threonine dehydratase